MKAKRILSVIAVGFVFAAGVVVGRWDAARLVDVAQAQVPGSGKCSLKTLKGAYGVKFDGQRIGIGPIVSVSRFTFDGNGEFTTNEIGRFAGNEVVRSFSGEYTVNEDCTGRLEFPSNLAQPHDAHGNFVIVDNGKELYLIDNEENWAASGVGKKL